LNEHLLTKDIERKYVPTSLVYTNIKPSPNAMGIYARGTSQNLAPSLTDLVQPGPNQEVALIKGASYAGQYLFDPKASSKA
jgi:hypothetical protein